MNLGNVFKQLQKRRVIRTAVIYVALLWAVLQAADLFADADILSEATVRLVIAVGVIGLPVVIMGSWFLESPFKGRRWLSILGDVSVILAIAVAAGLFAWQQWFTSFTRPIVAVLPIEATDTREDTQQLADHLVERFRMLLASRAELRVIELRSSRHARLDGDSIASKASVLNADFLIAGTLSRGGESLRLTVQLLDREGETLWSEVFSERLVDLSQLQSTAVAELATRLPLPGNTAGDLHQIIDSCDYPADSDAILAMSSSADLTEHLVANADSGLLYLAQAMRLFESTQAAPTTRKSVLQSLAMQSLGAAEQQCPDLAAIELLKIKNTRQAIADRSLLARFPNEAELYRRAAATFREDARALFAEALALDPTDSETLCYFADQQPQAIMDKWVPNGCDQR